MTEPLVEQDRDIRKAAGALHLTIHFDPRVGATPYRANNPRAARLLGQHCPRHWIVLDPAVQDVTPKHHIPPHLQVGDERHEVVEYVIVGKLAQAGVPRDLQYPIAHQIANKLQRRPGAENIVYSKVKVKLVPRRPRLTR